VAGGKPAAAKLRGGDAAVAGTNPSGGGAPEVPGSIPPVQRGSGPRRRWWWSSICSLSAHATAMRSMGAAAMARWFGSGKKRGEGAGHGSRWGMGEQGEVGASWACSFAREGRAGGPELGAATWCGGSDAARRYREGEKKQISQIGPWPHFVHHGQVLTIYS